MFTAEQLLTPISEAQPAGASLSFSSELDAIALARKFDDPSLDQGEWVTDLKEADWGFVVQRCAALLAGQSKDLRLAVWLTEAAAQQHQLRGLAEGYRVLAGLCEQYWDLGLYPEADGGDQDQRIGNLSWILARTPALVRAMPLTESRNGGYSTIDFETARKRANNSGSSNGSDSGASGDAPKLADMEAAKRNNSPQFGAAFVADAQYCVDALRQLEQPADARLGADSPGFAAARDALQAMLHAMPAASASAGAAGIGAGMGAGAGVGSGAGVGNGTWIGNGAGNGNGGGAAHLHAGSAGSAHAAGHPAGYAAGYGKDHGADHPGAYAQHRPAASGAIETRAQAIAQLRAVAQFFRVTEPHSPVSYFAEKAASAGEQDLHTWLRSVIKDGASLSHIEELLGVQPPN